LAFRSDSPTATSNLAFPSSHAPAHYGDYNSVSLHLFDDRRDPSPRFVIPGTGEFRPVRFVEFNEYANGALRYAEWTEGYPSAPIGEWLVEGKHTLLRRTVSLVVMTGEIAGTELQPFLTAPNVRDIKLDGERWVPAYPDFYPGGWAEPPAPPPALEKPYLPVFGGNLDMVDDPAHDEEVFGS
jgi:hypothetical protein